jgi:hypothetical protein
VRAPYADAYKPPDAPPRRPAPPPQDAYEPLGLPRRLLAAEALRLEVTRGYDTNPSHGSNSPASGFTVVEPTLKVQSQWARHEFGLDLRGSYSEYDKLSSLSRPLLDTKALRRIDVSRDTAINAEARLFLSTDYPGSPNLPVGFAKLPVFTTYGTTVGLTPALQPSRTDRQSDRRPHAIPEDAPSRRQHVEQPGPRLSINTAVRCARATRCSPASSRSSRSAATPASMTCNSTATACSATPSR